MAAVEWREQRHHWDSFSEDLHLDKEEAEKEIWSSYFWKWGGQASDEAKDSWAEEKGRVMREEGWDRVWVRSGKTGMLTSSQV